MDHDHTPGEFHVLGLALTTHLETGEHCLVVILNDAVSVIPLTAAEAFLDDLTAKVETLRRMTAAGNN